MFIANIALGSLHFISKDQPILFITLAVVIRFFQGIGDSISLSTSFSLVSMTFSEEKAIYIAYLESSWGLGTLVGPPLGSFVYAIGGYQMT